MQTLNAKFSKTAIGTNAFADQRIKIYQLFGKMSLEKPLLGHGLMAGLKYDGDLNDTELQNINLGIRTPHNIHLQIIFDLGSVGAVPILMSLLGRFGVGTHLVIHGEASAAWFVVNLVLAGLALSILLSGASI